MLSGAILAADNRTQTRAPHVPTCSACCTREDNSSAHRPVGTTSPDTDTHPFRQTAAELRDQSRRRRNPYLSRSRERRRNNRAPSPGAKAAASKDQNLEPPHHPIRTPPVDRRE